jgi:hypothetical protein
MSSPASFHFYGLLGSHHEPGDDRSEDIQSTFDFLDYGFSSNAH